MRPPDWQSDDGAIQLHCCDCAELLPTIEAGAVDACVTDPPFGVGNFVQTTGRISGRGHNKGKSVEWNANGPPQALFEHIRRIANHRIIWGANFFNCFEEKGGAIVWVKHQFMPNFSKAEVASCTHFKKTEIVDIPWNNFVTTRHAETDHPCERPVSLYEWCINYLPACMSFLDPYLGSGSMAIACIRQGKLFVGCEISREYFDIAVQRIKNELAQPRLFTAPVETHTQAEMFGASP